MARSRPCRTAKSMSRGFKASIADLRVRPFFAHGGTMSICEFIIGALNNEMGLQALDTEVTSAAGGWQCITPAGMALNANLTPRSPSRRRSATRVPQGQRPETRLPQRWWTISSFDPLNTSSRRSTNRRPNGSGPSHI